MVLLNRPERWFGDLVERVCREDDAIRQRWPRFRAKPAALGAGADAAEGMRALRQRRDPATKAADAARQDASSSC